MDAWTLDLGDSLIDRIYGGIEASSVVLLVVSEASTASGWVNREVNAALVREQQAGRKFLVPIKIDRTDLPLKVADRIFADFSATFSAQLVGLVSVLDRLGCRTMEFSSEREML